jgi:hypothetical protein
MAEQINNLRPEQITIKRTREPITYQNSVRVYRSSPERVTLQIRGENTWATASLPFLDARAIAAALVEETKD